MYVRLLLALRVLFQHAWGARARRKAGPPLCCPSLRARARSHVRVCVCVCAR